MVSVPRARVILPAVGTIAPSKLDLLGNQLYGKASTQDAVRVAIEKAEKTLDGNAMRHGAL